MNRRTIELAALGAVLLLIVLVFSDVLFLGRTFCIRDIARLHVPDRRVLRDIVESGEFPFWNPSYAGGQPFSANPTAEVFYPPQWLVFLPSFLRGVNLEVVLHYLLAAIGTFLLLRYLGLRIAACVFGSVTFALSSMFVAASALFPFFFALTWFPWLGLFTRRFLDNRRAADFALAAIVLGLILLIGEPAMIFEAGALVAAYAAWRLRNLRALVLAAAICGAALVAGSGQIVPAFDHEHDSGRAAGIRYDVAGTWSMFPLRPLELALPNLYGYGMSYWSRFDAQQDFPWLFSWYLGLLAAVLIVAGFIHRVRGWGFVAAFAIASYLLAIGRYGGVFRLLYLAGVKFIRFPEKFFFGAAFLLIVFAAIAADRFLGDAAFRRTTFFVAIAIAAIDAGVLAFTNGAARHGAMIMFGSAVALALILAVRENLRLCVPLLAIFVLADLVPRRSWLAPSLPDDFFDAPPIARSIHPPARVYNDAIWQIVYLPNPPDIGAARWLRARNAMYPDMQRVYGLDGALEVDTTITNLNPAEEFYILFHTARFRGRPDLVAMLLSFAGVTHVVTLRDAASAVDPVRIVELPNVRYYFAEALAESRRIVERRPWPRRIAFVDHPFAPAPGRIVHSAGRANAIDMDVVTGGNAALVISVTPHKYWRATIDGAPAPLYRANVGFQALTVPRGTHHIAMRYRNPLVVVFGIVSLVSFVALAVIAATDAGLRSRGPQPPSPR